jgi:hypothetical protein
VIAKLSYGLTLGLGAHDLSHLFAAITPWIRRRRINIFEINTDGVSIETSGNLLDGFRKQCREPLTVTAAFNSMTT